MCVRVCSLCVFVIGASDHGSVVCVLFLCGQQIVCSQQFCLHICEFWIAVSVGWDAIDVLWSNWVVINVLFSVDFHFLLT